MRRGIARHALAALALGAGLTAVEPPRRAEAFCGFYVSGSSEQLVNKATRVALMRRGTRTVLSMSNDYQGPAQDFAMVVPVPVVLQQDNVRTLPHDVFNHLEQLTAPRLVEYWEQDPCYVPPPMRFRAMSRSGAAPPSAVSGGAGSADLGVRIEARFVVGEYQVLILSATQSSGLETWLRQNRYNIPQGAAAALAPYVRDQWKFFVARVDINRVQRRPDGSARLSPLRFHYDAAEFRLPVRLGLLNAGGLGADGPQAGADSPRPPAQDLIVYVLSPSSRFEMANYTNAFIPTNLDVVDGVRTQFGEFYAQLFDQTLASAGGRAVVTEYAWSTSSCDPCPSPPLAPNELSVLGADAIQNAPDGPNAQPGTPFSPYNMVVTRMHTRYNRATLTDDLVFREAPPVTGGRESGRDANGGIERGARVTQGGSGYANNFQARYAIRHAWTGPIRCANPVRGRWGGPPNGQSAPPPAAARDLADVRRGAVSLPQVIRTPVPELNLRPAPAGRPGANPGRSGSTPPGNAPPGNARPAQGANPGAPANTPAPRNKPGGPLGIAGTVLGALALVSARAAVRRRMRRK